MKEIKTGKGFPTGAKVLVRNGSSDVWKYAVYAAYDDGNEIQPHVMQTGKRYENCMRAHRNEPYAGTTWNVSEDDWKPKEGDAYWTVVFSPERGAFLMEKRFWLGNIEDKARFAAHLAFAYADGQKAYILEQRLNEVIARAQNVGEEIEPLLNKQYRT